MACAQTGEANCIKLTLLYSHIYLSFEVSFVGASNYLLTFCAGFSFSNKFGAEELQTGNRTHHKIVQKSKDCFAVKMKLLAIKGDNHGWQKIACGLQKKKGLSCLAVLYQ